MASRYRVVLVTAPGKSEASLLAKGLVEKKLAACVSVLPGVESTFRWKGKVETESEVLLLIKTQKGLVDNIITFVRETLKAETPEIISLPVMEGFKNYLEWVGANTNLAEPFAELAEDDEEVR